jgi:hypothetical protein
MKSSIKNYIDFIKETDVVGHDEVTATKPTALSEAMCEKLNQMCEAMCEEMKACHADETEMTAENYRKECESKINEMYESISKACNEIMKEGSYNDSDGDMRQGSIQDVPVMAGAVR